MENKAVNHIFNDILGKVLELSENPSQFGEYLTQQIRELVGARTIVISVKTETGQSKIFSVFPTRRTEWANQSAVLQLADISFSFETIQYLDKGTGEENTTCLLQQLEIDKAIAIPLIAANRHVGSIILLDIMDLLGTDSVISLLNQLSGIFALVIRNSSLFQNMEELVAARTEELQKRNDELEKAIHRAEKSELQARDILQTALDGFWTVDIKGRFIEVNEVACKMLGYTREEMLNMSVPDIVFEESEEQAKTRIEEITQNGEGQFESKHRCKDGKIIDVELSVKVQPSQNLLVVFISDITERKRAEKHIQQSEERFQLAMKATNDGLFDWNLVTNAIYYSPGWKKMLGYEDHELPNDFTVWENTTDPDDVKASWELQQKLINKEVDRFVMEFKMKHKNGHWVDILSQAEAFFNEDGKAIRIVGTHSDMSERNKAQIEIQEINEMFSQYLKHSPIYTYIKDVTPNESVMLQASENFIDLVGISGNEMIGKNMAELFTPEFAAKITSDDWAVASGDMVLKLDEELNGRSYSTIKFPFKRGNKTLLAGYSIDITERKNSERELSNEKQTLANILEGTNSGTWNWNIQTGAVILNERWANIIGYTLEELQPIDINTWINHVHPDDLLMTNAALQKLFNKETAYYDVEFRQPHKNGTWVWVNARGKVAEWTKDGKPIVMTGTHLDITERKRAEIELIEAKELAEAGELKLLYKNEELNQRNIFIQTILENLPVGLALNKLNEGTVTYMNNKFQEIYGWPSDEIGSIALFFEKVYPDEEYRKQLIERIMSDINSGDTDRMHWEDIRITCSDGSKKIVNTVNIPLIEQNTMVSTVMDITSLYQTQNELIVAKEHAEESDRLKSAFLANMSHEIRTPMNGILGFAELLKEPDLTSEQHQEYIRIIEKGGARMLNIINDIIDISKIESGQMNVSVTETNVNEQIEYLYKFFQHEAENKGLQLLSRTALKGEKALLHTDREKLYAILTNLVKNAIKFTSKGFIEFGVSTSSTTGSVSEPGSTEQSRSVELLQFYVKDTGIGIPSDRQDAIFERFIHADISKKHAYQGAGLGLAISKAYVEMLGGKIWVESEEGKGSTFYFELPFYSEAKEQEVTENEIQPAAEENKMKILIVEDDESSAKLMTMIVGKFCKEILRAINGVEAVEICRDNPDIDLVLMDIQLPVMNGYEATQHIRQFNPNVVIIAQTAFALSGDSEKAMESGCTDYITKPIKRDKLMELIRMYFKK